MQNTDIGADKPGTLLVLPTFHLFQFSYSSPLTVFLLIQAISCLTKNKQTKKKVFVCFLSDHKACIHQRKERIYLFLTSLLFLLFRYAPGTFPDMLPSVFNIAIWESDIAHRLWCCSAGMEFVISLLADSCGSVLTAAHRRGMPSLWGCQLWDKLGSWKLLQKKMQNWAFAGWTLAVNSDHFLIWNLVL